MVWNHFLHGHETGEERLSNVLLHKPQKVMGSDKDIPAPGKETCKVRHVLVVVVRAAGCVLGLQVVLVEGGGGRGGGG